MSPVLSLLRVFVSILFRGSMKTPQEDQGSEDGRIPKLGLIQTDSQRDEATDALAAPF